MTPVMKKLLIVFHAPSDNTRALMDAIKVGAENEAARVETLCLSPFDTQPSHVLAADAIILGTPENLAYMSGALKDFFDRCYYPVLDHKQGLPVAALVRAGSDGTGTCNALKTILTGLKWRWVQAPLVCRGEWQPDFVQQAHELGEAMATALAEGMI